VRRYSTFDRSLRDRRCSPIMYRFCCERAGVLGEFSRLTAAYRHTMGRDFGGEVRTRRLDFRNNYTG